MDMLNDAIWTERMLNHSPRSGDHRTPYDVDYSRVIHSEAFRRLAGVTQILGIADGDFHRNRLTHTIEVGQVALGIIQKLRATAGKVIEPLLPTRALMETISAIHDIGHPPFGHGGEVALNFCMREHGGFEGNGQTLRILTGLMDSSSTKRGANLTRRTLLGALKYPVAYSQVEKEGVMHNCVSPITGLPMLSHQHHEPPKCYLDTEAPIVQWLMAPFSIDDQQAIVETKAKSFDCTIMDMSDDIAYGVHDLEDAIALGLVSREQMTKDVPPSLWDEFISNMAADYPCEYQRFGQSLYEGFLEQLFENGTKAQIGRLVHYMISNTYVQVRERFEEPMYRHAATIRPAASALLSALKKFIRNRVIRAPEVQQLRFKGQQMIVQLFAYLHHDPRHLLPTPVWNLHMAEDTETGKMRVLCDYVAAMTDAGLSRTYKRLFDPTAGSVFDSLR